MCYLPIAVYTFHKLLLTPPVAEFGDYCINQCDGQEYLSEVRLIPEQTKDIESKIMEHHIEHRSVFRMQC